MTIKPLGDRLLMKLSNSDNCYKGSLIIPENARQRTRIFEIVDVGKDVRNIEDLKIGNKVLISFYTGIFIDLIHEVSPENLRIVAEDEIIAVIKD